MIRIDPTATQQQYDAMLCDIQLRNLFLPVQLCFFFWNSTPYVDIVVWVKKCFDSKPNHIIRNVGVAPYHLVSFWNVWKKMGLGKRDPDIGSLERSVKIRVWLQTEFRSEDAVIAQVRQAQGSTFVRVP